ncbi:MAG: HAMP domain-containing histidine kinase [Firmicutes bacterium]|nr:HAMP domain-containing histidine kinase [Bacillota bacterium]
MNFLSDKLSRSFLTAIISAIILLCIFDIISAANTEKTVRHIMSERDNAVVTSLIQNGIPETAAAAAITNTETSAEASAFLKKLGISESTDTHFIPFAENLRYTEISYLSIKASLYTIFFIGAAIIFMKKRENLYIAASKTVSDYTAGIFTDILPCGSDGSIYVLFDRLNNMAASLKSKQETEKSAKEFLKNIISDISHQLKTPLAALSTYTEIIEAEADNAETVKEFAKKSKLAEDRMKDLITSLLKIARLDAGSINFASAPYPISELIERSVQSLTLRAKQEGKELFIKGHADEILVCDIVWTTEAIENIIKNALDHTKCGDMIEITWGRSAAETYIRITDSGSGISPEDFYHIFKRFYRGKNPSDAHGIGLGLPLTKAIIEGQLGTLMVSCPPDGGTVFTISFPNSTNCKSILPYKTVR